MKRVHVGWDGVLILGTATGVVMAVLALTDRLYLSPLGTTPTASTVAVFAAHTDTGRSRELTSYAAFADWRRATSVSALSGVRAAFANIVGHAEPERLRAALVATQFFDAVGASTPLGRTLRDDDYLTPGTACVISHALWRRRFNADPAVIGSSVQLEVSGERPTTFTVVGIASPGFDYPNRTDVWLPYVPTAAASTNYSGQWFGVIGRLRPGVDAARARAELTAIMREVQLAHPRTQPAHVANVVPLHDVLTAGHQTLVAALGLAAGLLWLSAMATVGASLAGRALRTRHEYAVRVSLGVSRRQLVLDAVMSGLVHGVAAMLVALVVARLTLVLLPRLETAAFAVAADVSVSWSVGVATLAALAVVYTGIPLVLTARTVRALAIAGPYAWAGDRLAGADHAWLRSVLVVAQIAVTVVAMVLAAAILARLTTIEDVRLGFSGDDVLTVRLELPASRYESAQVPHVVDAALRQLQRLPGVVGVAAASDEPLFGQSANPEFVLQLENRPLAPDERAPVLVNGVPRDYVSVLRIPVLTGEAAALDGGEMTALVNESFTRRFYADRSPVGRRLRFGGADAPWWTIVGVVADTRNDGPLMPPKATVYMNSARFSKTGMTLFARISDGGDETLPAIRTALAALDPALPIGRIAPAMRLVRERFADVWVASRGLLAVSGAALILAMFGLVSVQFALATELRPEVAVRAAMGAGPRDIAWFFGRRVAPLIVAGVATGTVAGLLAAKGMAAYAAVAQPHPLLVVLIASAVAAVALVVSAWPMADAARTDPALTLRAR